LRKSEQSGEISIIRSFMIFTPTNYDDQTEQIEKFGECGTFGEEENYFGIL
jgi:hypothetical protein